MRLKRVISAVILLSAVIACTVVGSYALGVLVLLFIVAGLYEIFRAFEQKGYKPMKIPGFCFAGIFLLQLIFGSPDIFHIYLFENENFSWSGPLFVLLLLTMLTVMVFRHKKYTPADAAVTFFGAFYVTVLTSFALSLREIDGGKGGLFVFLLAMITDVCSDTFAYEVGSRIGKHKLIPAVSPKKSVEGSIGAFAGSIIGGLLLGVLFIYTGWFTAIKLFWYPVVGLFVGFLSQVGDLSASMIKRYVGIKDFSNIIPGHGGVIDRLDSLMFVFPAVYYFVRLIM